MQIFIPGKPQGKGRPRYWKGHAVTPESTRTYESIVAKLWKILAKAFYEKAVYADIKAYYLVPKSYTKKQKMAIARGEQFPTITPDIDNIIKIVFDGLNKIAYLDDKQVCKVTAEKFYTFDEKQEGVQVRLKEYKRFKLPFM